MSGACASAMATSAHTMTSTNNKMAPTNFRRRIGMAAPTPSLPSPASGGGEGGGKLRGRGQALYGPRAPNKRSAMTTVPLSEARARAIRLWLYAVAALVLAMVLVGGAT